MFENEKIELLFGDDVTPGKYCGWSNCQTWDVALWLENDPRLYELVKSYSSYKALAQSLADHGIFETQDGVPFNDSALDIAALDDLLQEYQR